MGGQKVAVTPEELVGKSAWFSGFFCDKGNVNVMRHTLEDFLNAVLFGTDLVD
jgi:hypothetical protein